MPTVLFHQSKKQEIETVLWTIKNHKYLEQFCDKIICPKLSRNLWQLIINDDETFKNSRAITKKYLEKTNQLVLQKGAKEKLIPLWKKCEDDFFNKTEKILKTKLPTKYICYLTKYGGGGSFNPPNTIWVRANIQNKKDVKYFAYTIAHEIIHLLMEKKNQGKSQQAKEKEVEKILIKTKIFK